MGFKQTVASLLAFALPWALGHGIHDKIPLGPIERPDLSHCSREFNHPDFVKKTVDRHLGEFHRLRRDLGIETEPLSRVMKRDYLSVSKIDHKSNKTVTATTDPATLFSDAGACMLMPAVDQGPLYVLGEQVRKDITEGEPGIKTTLAIQVVDYKTCKVVPNAYVDIWSSNSTGTYVGVQGYPGMGDPKDPSILNGTAMRGVQPVDDHGIAVFNAIMPGHYTGRATHIHAIVYLGATKQPNNTITGGHAAHVGQLYFDQSLITNADKVTPYNQNKMTIVPNIQDFLFRQGANGDDPIVRYAMLTSKLEDGMFAWIRFGVNQNNNLKVNPAAFMTDKGGVMNPTGPIGQIGGGWGGGGGGGGFPGSGWPPTTGGHKRGENKEEEEEPEVEEEE